MPAEPEHTTLFAPATGFGRAAISVIRISGPASGPLIEALSGRRPEPRFLSLRTLRDPDSREPLDRALVAWLPGPATFTGEDMAELHLHGGVAVRSAVLKALAAFPGCRSAGPGAFARRAVLNGRIDIAQAEATADLVDAETQAQRRQAFRQLEGALGRQVTAWRSDVIDLLAQAEACLDFSDEGDVDEAALAAELVPRIVDLRNHIQAALADARRGERLREGFSVVLAGPPNSGKSTLMNVIAGRDVAIVSTIPGTTRDVIEVRCDISGLPVILSDTAGLRETSDALELEGISRTRRRVAEADIVLDLRAADHIGGPIDEIETAARKLVVTTKADLLPDPPNQQGILVSATTGAGIEQLLETLRGLLEGEVTGDALITRERHREALQRSAEHLSRASEHREKGFEFLTEDLRLAARALGEVGGHVGTDDVLDRLFAGFCIGK